MDIRTMKSRRRGLLTAFALALLLPTASHALVWGEGNFGEKNWGIDEILEVIPALPEVGLGFVALCLAATAWWLMTAHRRSSS